MALKITPSHTVPARRPAPAPSPRVVLPPSATVPSAMAGLPRGISTPLPLFPKIPIAPPTSPLVGRPKTIPGSPWPVIFYDTVTVNSNGEQALRSQAFTNNTGRAIEFHSLRVEINLLAFVPGGTNLVFQGGGVIALEIAVDGVPVTRGPVPVWNFCRSDNRLSDNFVQSGVTSYVWYFTQPFPLLPGKTITVQVRHLGITTQPATVYVSFAGRASPVAIPKRIPYAASWQSVAFAFAAAGFDSAPPSALVNDTGHDLTVNRIIGRAVAFDDASTSGVTQSFLDFGDISTQAISSLSCRLGLSQDRPILKHYTPMRTVFGVNAAIETDFVLKAGDYLTCDVQHTAGAALLTPFNYSQNRASVSIVGWREM